ncbi:MAG: DNA topoisomerase I [Candidatus Thermoplasmatota archaeon]
MKKCIICEKALSAKRIAEILSGGKHQTKKIDGFQIYNFVRDGDEYKVLGLVGHIVTLDYPPKYNIWFTIAPKELINVEPCKTIKEKKIASLLQEIGKECDEIIVATDYDREGELIGYEAIELLEKVRKVNVRRARFSAITKEDVEKAFRNLSLLDENLALSAYTRQCIDLVWGATLTRFISLASKQTGKDFLSVGRVQSPTLALVVEREEKIEKFKPKPYWELLGKFEKSELIFEGSHVKGKFFVESEVKALYEKIKKSKEGKVAKIEQKKRYEASPPPFNTTLFLASASGIGVAPAKAMRIAEDLYMNGYISYPRTDNTVYPKTLDLNGTIKKFFNSEFKEFAEELHRKIYGPSKGKVFATDHPPIYPTEALYKEKLTADNWRIYELIVRRFFATLAPPFHMMHTEVNLDVLNEVFVAKGMKFLSLGWRKYYPYGLQKEIKLPGLIEGEFVRVKEFEILKKKTEPPKRYSQGSLIQTMEKHGLGTKATRHEIIQKLYERNYIREKNPVPTQSGIAVTKALKTYAEKITKAEMTSLLEIEMDKVACGEKRYEEVIDESKQFLTDVMEQLEKSKKEIGIEIISALRKQNTVGKCIKCSGELLIMRSKKGKRFIGCSNFPKCRHSYPLPQKGKIVPLYEECKFCGEPKIKILMKKKPWIMCISTVCKSKNEQQIKENNNI